MKLGLVFSNSALGLTPLNTATLCAPATLPPVKFLSSQIKLDLDAIKLVREAREQFK